LTAPSPAKSVYGDQTLTLNQAGQADTTYPAVKLTLTGGRTVGRGTSTHIVSSVTLNSFTVAFAPTFTSVSPSANTSVNTTAVGYTLSETIASGSVKWSRTGGTADGTVHTAALTGTELNTGTFVSAVLTNAPTLVDGAIYTIAFNGTDAAGNAAAEVEVIGITYDITAPTFTSVSPSANTSVNTTAVGYTLSEAIASGSVVWTVLPGGTPDTNSPHTAALTGPELNAGVFASTILTNPPTLVDGAIYKIEFNGMDAAGNTTQVSVTGITYDTPVISLGLGPNPLLTQPTPYMNQVQTPSTFEIKSTKAGTIALSLHTATNALGTTAIPANTDTTFTLASITPSNNSEAYEKLTVTVTDALGNVSLPFAIADGALTNGLYSPPKDAYIIDKAVPTPLPSSSQNQQANGETTINFVLEQPTANTAPYKPVATLDVGAITITGVGLNSALNGISPSSVSVVQQTYTGNFDSARLVINLGTLATTSGPGDPNEITVSYNPAQVANDANKIQDESGNMMAAFGPIAIIVN
jgi:hypothetical protein